MLCSTQPDEQILPSASRIVISILCFVSGCKSDLCGRGSSSQALPAVRPEPVCVFEMFSSVQRYPVNPVKSMLTSAIDGFLISSQLVLMK